MIYIFFLRYYEASVDELKKYVKRVKNDDVDEVSQPYLSPAILKIVEYDYNVEEKIDNVDKKIDERFDTLSEEFKNLVEKIAELTGPIKNEKDKDADE